MVKLCTSQHLNLLLKKIKYSRRTHTRNKMNQQIFKIHARSFKSNNTFFSIDNTEYHDELKEYGINLSQIILRE